jgi:uncharacterized protein
MHYLLLYDVVDDYVGRRRGELLLGGALADPVNGAVLLFQGPTPHAARAFAT